MRRLIVSVSILALLAPLTSAFADPPARGERPRGCPSEMVRVHDFCVDRWELSTVDAKSLEPLSPFYPPNLKMLTFVRDAWLVERQRYGTPGARAMPLPELSAWQREHAFEPLAVARPGVVPQAYLSYHMAKLACSNAGKRLCTKSEWVSACRGEQDLKYPSAATFSAQRCNVHRAVHPAHVLHASSSLGLLDPRLNLVWEGDEPLLRLTGATPTCASTWGSDRVFDMVGNLDEWVDEGMFLGGFYARSTTRGCDAQVSSHATTYFDYSTGARCCSDAH